MKNGRNLLFNILHVCLLLLFLFMTSKAQNIACEFDAKTMQFVGTPLEQAKCLLRPNKPRGILDNPLEKLPKPLENIIDKNVNITKQRLRHFLSINEIDEKNLGGDLSVVLSDGKLLNGDKIPALYFVIHDTSTPNYEKSKFPADINEKTWKFNNLSMWLDNPVGHIFINRLGESVTTTPFSETVRKGWGTKFAREILKADGKGLQLHIELVQPRRSSLEWFAGNDEIAPQIGFTNAQYERLALVYVCASFRRGTWLIPAYHSAIDAGIKGAHDDPQNFELEKFAKSLDGLIKKIS